MSRRRALELVETIGACVLIVVALIITLFC